MTTANAPLWAVAPDDRRDAFVPDAHCDVLVVGAGATGLAAAASAAEHHADVIVVDAHHPGALTSGRSTGKITFLQGVRLSTIRDRTSMEVAAAYLDATRIGAERIRALCADGPGYEVAPAYSYATTEPGVDALAAERQVANDLGLPVVDTSTPELPFDVSAALRLDDQFMIDPGVLVGRLVSSARQHGARIISGCTATAVHASDDGYDIETGLGPIRAGAVIVATGTPFLNRGMHFARLEASRSFVAAFRGETAPLRGMYLSVADDTKSLRPAHAHGADHLIVSGGHHLVGRSDSPAQRVAALHEWASAQFPGLRLTHTWAAQDYESTDAAPYVGPIHLGENGILVATGFAKWGLAASVAAGIALAESVRDDAPSWVKQMQAGKGRGDAGRLVARNAEVVAQLVSGAAHATMEGSPDEPAEGQGAVGFEHGRLTGVCRIDGETHRVSAVCTHLGGTLRWNDAEHSWDCPLHGSRFRFDGARIEGPAREGLRTHSDVPHRGE
ncbi:FAD-dependent oxidoreductase [Agromyces sp. SYSU K20354]|uniref:FAD-dependent oxidoreductase n=1 Tax=Agromyces cavernae TaxID=2898659 RepID=UPI001E40845E|nr:FAD-dependent oxidoreductase [Agromyces cavernae]MCD2440736.1 FAD-dependent oxidoreductase [Agromyces cavernae]